MMSAYKGIFQQVIQKHRIRLNVSRKTKMTENRKLEEFLLSKPLGDVDELLGEYYFFRIHNSSLVNLKYIKKYIRG
jgi:DNA-binding LytR/AlgR family response regulator